MPDDVALTDLQRCDLVAFFRTLSAAKNRAPGPTPESNS